MKHVTISLRFQAPLLNANLGELTLLLAAALRRQLRTQVGALPIPRVARLECSPFYLLEERAGLLLQFAGMALVMNHATTK